MTRATSARIEARVASSGAITSSSSIVFMFAAASSGVTTSSSIVLTFAAASSASACRLSWAAMAASTVGSCVRLAPPTSATALVTAAESVCVTP